MGEMLRLPDTKISPERYRLKARTTPWNHLQPSAETRIEGLYKTPEITSEVLAVNVENVNNGKGSIGDQILRNARSP